MKAYSDFLLRLITFRDHDNEYTKWIRENQKNGSPEARKTDEKVEIKNVDNTESKKVGKTETKTVEKTETKNVGDPQKIVVKQITSGLRKVGV